ncbi:MAG: porin family protein [Candidatus Margulisiibacteriota bacterium]
MKKILGMVLLIMLAVTPIFSQSIAPTENPAAANTKDKDYEEFLKYRKFMQYSEEKEKLKAQTPTQTITYTNKLEQQTLKYGYKAGLAIGLAPDTVRNAGTLGTAYLSLFAEQKFSPEWWIDAELALSGKGFSYTVNGVGVNYSFTYIEVPLLLSYHTGFGPQFLFGPYVGYAINQSASSGGYSVTLSNDFNKFDYGLTAGLAIPFQIGTHEWKAEARYSKGLAKVLADPEIYNGVVSILVSYAM